jgi:hypothetical protein
MPKPFVPEDDMNENCMDDDPRNIGGEIEVNEQDDLDVRYAEAKKKEDRREMEGDETPVDLTSVEFGEKEFNLLTNIYEFGEYRKIATIKAVRICVPFKVKTKEGYIESKGGDWLAIGIEGERWIISDAIFRKTYVEVK